MLTDHTLRCPSVISIVGTEISEKDHELFRLKPVVGYHYFLSPVLGTVHLHLGYTPVQARNHGGALPPIFCAPLSDSLPGEKRLHSSSSSTTLAPWHLFEEIPATSKTYLLASTTCSYSFFVIEMVFQFPIKTWCRFRRVLKFPE